ncbi:MAG TPA: beta-ketoacyl synthase N-terminal-like domain-containing protein [Sedimentisphaerales bacterium]
MTFYVRGIGWLTKTGYGSVRLGLHHQFAPGEGIHSLVKLGIFSQPFKNFRRLDVMSRLTVSAVALALQDAGLEYSPADKQDIGIIGTSREGSLKSDVDYFRDFMENGRTLSLANLFIYTLPSSALGEAAIHFGLTGPLLFATGVADSFAEVLDMATEIIVAREAGRMLVGRIEDEEALYLVIDGKQTDNSLCTLIEMRSIIASARDISDILHQLASLKVKKGIA